MTPTPTSGERPQRVPQEVDLEIGETVSGNINFNMIGGQSITVSREFAARVRDRLTHLLTAPTPDAEALARELAEKIFAIGTKGQTRESLTQHAAALLLATIARLVAEKDGAITRVTMQHVSDAEKYADDLTTARAETRDWIAWHGEVKEKLQEANARIGKLEKAADGMAEALEKTLSQLQAVIVAVSLGTYTNRKELMAENVITEGNSALTAYRASRRNQEPEA